MKDIMCEGGAVVAADGFAARAGADILRRGGNAVDATIAAALVECVVQPQNVGLGGYAGTAVIYSAKIDAVIAVDFTGLAPLAASPGMFLGLPGVCRCNGGSDGGPEVPNERGYLCVVAPPILAGLATILERYGTMSLDEVAEQAQRLAEEGFAVYPGLQSALTRFTELAGQESVRAMLPDGIVPKAGDLWVQSDLAAVFARVRKSGLDEFYSGDIPRKVSAQVRDHGGVLDEADFLIVSPRLEEPVSVRCGEYDVFTTPPPAGGVTALQILKVMDQLEPIADTQWSAAHYHSMIEAARHAWNDRDAYFGDPLFTEIPVGELLSDDHARETLARIRSGVGAVSMADAAAAGHTVHLSAVDSDHNMVSLTATQGASLGSLVAIEGLGMLMGNGMSRFDVDPGKPNSVAPGKRMQHNMSPLIMTRNGRPYCAVGLPGGRKIVNVAALMACAITQRGLTCGEAMDVPRFHVEGCAPAQVDSEDLAAKLRNEYGADYHVNKVGSIGGPIAGVMIDQATHQLLAASSGGPGNIGVAEGDQATP